MGRVPLTSTPKDLPVATAERFGLVISAPPSGPAIFELLEPLKLIVDGAEVSLDGIEMREMRAADLELLDRFRGQPIALARNVVAALCDLTVEQVCQLHLDDFAMLASDALWQVEQLSEGMGLAGDFFLQQPREQSTEAAC